jgi:hypothetical protein
MKHEMLSTIVTLALMFVLPGCGRKAVDEQAGQLVGGLPAAAYRTYRNYLHGVRSGTEEASGVISSQYWAEGIRALNPLRVYMHRYNVVVVQRESGEIEEGRYVYIPISSYMPVNGDDGFTFTRVEGDVYNFTRVKRN